MNLILFGAGDIVEKNRIRLDGERLTHLREVLDASEGDELRVGEINGKMGRATLLSIDEQAALLSIDLTDQPPAKIPLTLVLALPRPKMLRRILRTVAEMGIGELHLINSYRVEKSYWQTPVLEAEVLEGYFLQGLSQSRDPMLPRLCIHKRFKPFVEDELPTLIGESRAVLAHPGAYPPLTATAQSTLAIIGPEGGFIEYEVEKMQQAGCEIASMGPRILRVENAVTSLISRF